MRPHLPRLPSLRPLASRLPGALACALAATLAACGGGGGVSPGTAEVAIAKSASGTDAPVDQLIVQPADASLLAAYERRSQEFAAAVSGDAGLPLTAVRQVHTGAHVLALPGPVSAAEAARIASRIARRSDVAYVEPDVMLHPSSIPNDPSFTQQWHLREPASSAGGMNAVDAWDLTLGDPNLVIAVVDTGVLPHRELAGRLLTGYDFIATLFNANDGNPRENDASDPGDWLTTAEANSLDRTAKSSSWHGTHVAGTVAAAGNNGSGVAGVNWRSKILPVRVLGKGGGRLSDIADGIAWAAGGSVPGVPANPTPARVINLSLGGQGACSATTQAAINTATGRGAVVVVAAGNEAVNVANVQPANCAGVISVAAVGARGQQSSYTNFGSGVTVAAPGGDPGADSGVLSLGNTGARAPEGETLLASYGTSMAAPHVAGVVSLMLSVNPSLTPADVKSLLQSTARAFPTGTGRDCSTSRCGSGIANAGAAVRAAANATVTAPTLVPQSGIWWNPSENGRGYVIEIRDGKLNFGGYLYDASGRATWVSSGPSAMSSPTTFSGTLDSYSGGQTLTGAYKPPTGRTTAGSVSLTFQSPTTATLVWPGGAVAIQRFRFGAPANAPSSFTPEAGVWWAPQESGRGFAIEVQNGTLFMSGFMYDAAGQPIWHLTAGPMASPTQFNGTFVQYAGGQTLTGPYKAPTVSNPNLGPVSLRFIDTGTAQLTLPNGNTLALEKFRIGGEVPSVVMPINRILTAKLVGIWQIDYTIQTQWTDYFLFNEVRESSLYPGEYNVWGFNQYDTLSIGGWAPELEQHVILAPGELFDDFYVFDMPTPNTMRGCFYLLYSNPSRLSDCYELDGVKLQEIAPLAIDLPRLGRPARDAATRATLLARESGAAASVAVGAAAVRKAPVLARKPEVDAALRAAERQRALVGR